MRRANLEDEVGLLELEIRDGASPDLTRSMGYQFAQRNESHPGVQLYHMVRMSGTAA
jgi:hypothetical protein